MPAAAAGSSPRRWLRRILVGLGVLVLLFVALVIGLGWAFSGPVYRGPRSDHFDGKRFHNLAPRPGGGFGDFMRWQLGRRQGPWQQRTAPPGPPPPRRVGRGELRVTFINHATVLVQQDGINLLTDPIWSDRTSPVSFAGPRRHQPPGLRFEDLPPIDVVSISHNHYDHLDLPTLRRLHTAHRPRFFVGLGNRALLEGAGIATVTELDWWQQVTLEPDLVLIAVPNQHFSNRGLFDRDRTLWTSYVLRGPAGMSYLAGDTGDGPHFDLVRQRLGSPRLAVLPIGAFRPEWFMSRVHVSPEEAVRAHERLGAGTSVGMHFGTFPLADDGQDEPVTALRAALARRPPPAPRFWVLGFGEGRDVPSAGVSNPVQ